MTPTTSTRSEATAAMNRPPFPQSDPAQRGQITTAVDVKAFLTGGNAVGTLAYTPRGSDTQVHYTFRVRISDDRKRYFVSVLTGPDNRIDWTYIGNFRMGRFGQELWPTRGSDALSKPGQVFDRFARRVAAGDLPSTVQFWHEGRCGRCHRRLTVPSSIATGLGPICASTGGA